MSSPTHSLNVAAVAHLTTPMVLGRQDLYRDAVQMTDSASDFVSCDLAPNPGPSEKRGSYATGFNFLCSPPLIVTSDWELTGRTSNRRRRFGLLGYPHQLGLGIAGLFPVDFALAEDLVE